MTIARSSSLKYVQLQRNQMGDRGARAIIQAVILSYARKCELVQESVDPAYEDTAHGTGWSVNPEWLVHPDDEYKYVHVDRPGGGIDSGDEGWVNPSHPELIPYGPCVHCGKERSEHYKGTLDTVLLTGNSFGEDVKGWYRAYGENHRGWDDHNCPIDFVNC